MKVRGDTSTIIHVLPLTWLWCLPVLPVTSLWRCVAMVYSQPWRISVHLIQWISQHLSSDLKPKSEGIGNCPLFLPSSKSEMPVLPCPFSSQQSSCRMIDHGWRTKQMMLLPQLCGFVKRWISYQISSSLQTNQHKPINHWPKKPNEYGRKEYILQICCHLYIRVV